MAYYITYHYENIDDRAKMMLLSMDNGYSGSQISFVQTCRVWDCPFENSITDIFFKF